MSTLTYTATQIVSYEDHSTLVDIIINGAVDVRIAVDTSSLFVDFAGGRSFNATVTISGTINGYSESSAVTTWSDTFSTTQSGELFGYGSTATLLSNFYSGLPIASNQIKLNFIADLSGVGQQTTFNGITGGTFTYLYREDFGGVITYPLSLHLATSDIVAPTLLSTSPIDNATGVMANTNVVLTFNEAVKAGAGSIEIRRSSDNNLFRSIAVTDASQVTFSGATITINPSIDLALGTGYYIVLGAGVIRDLSGNSYAGISSATTLNFTTADVVAPSLISTSPSVDAAGVSTNANIVLGFDEGVEAGSGVIEIRRMADNSLFRSIAATDTSQVTISGSTVTINPSADLSIGTWYYVLASSDAIKDLSGNRFKGISEPSTLSFTTAGSVSIKDALTSEGNNGTKVITFNVTRTGGPAAFSVNYSTANGTATTEDNDYLAAQGILHFGVGVNSQTITVTLVGDTKAEKSETFVVTLSGSTNGIPISDNRAVGTIFNDDVLAVDDAYVVLRGQMLSVGPLNGVIANDENGYFQFSSLLSPTSNGNLQFNENGSFKYEPVVGFTGRDEFIYRAVNATSHDEGKAIIYVVPMVEGPTATLNLLSLTVEQQLAATYAAFFGRGADAAGFAFWRDQFITALPTQGPALLFANVASSFGISNEAKSLYPFLVDPFGANDQQIVAFLESVYLNLFGRSSDAPGLAYWTEQTKATLAAGQFVGSVLIHIVSGAQDTDINTLIGKVAVSLHYVEEQEKHHMEWRGDSDAAAAAALLYSVTSDVQSVLLGIRTAEYLVANHV